MKLEKIGTADRMMFYCSSSDENSYVNQANLVLKEAVQPDALKAAIKSALKIFRNFKMRLVVEDEILFYAEHDAELPVFPEEGKLYRLGTADTNHYLFRMTYKEKELILSYFHGVSDAIGASMFIAVTLDEYYKTIDAAYAERYTESMEKRLEIVDIPDPFAEYAAHRLLPLTLPNTRKVFSVQGKVEESKSYEAQKYVLSVPQKQVMTFAKENKTTPVAFFITALANAIGRSHNIGKKEHVICMLPANLRTIYGANTCRNFSHIVTLPFKKEYEKLSFSEQCVSMRADLKTVTSKKNMSVALQQQVLIGGFLENNKKPLIERSRQMLRAFMEGASSMCTYEISYLGSIFLPDGLKEKVESMSYSHRGCSGFPWILIYTDKDQMHMEFINYTGDTKLFDSLKEVLKEQGCDSELSLSDLAILDKFVLADAIQ